MNKSIATIDSPEFINLSPLEINPLMSQCEIKVLYIGANRNGSYITKEVATEMSKTLRGAPIVGYYKKEKEDFRDHGERLILDEEIRFECLTKPYGFVAPDAKVWFQNFDDTDEFGNVTTREYLMTTGYLWTGQFEECKLATEEGRPHSMELDEESLDGHWATDNKNGREFFIINDATFSKLCILGEDVEPCFEGSSITSPNVSKNFSLDKDFKQTLFNMMEDLKNLLSEGGNTMPVEQNADIELENQEVETQFEQQEEAPAEVPAEEQVEAPVEEVVETEEAPVEFKKEDEKEEEEKGAEEESDEEKEDSESEEDDDKKKKKDYELLESEYNDLTNKFNDLTSAYQALKENFDKVNEELSTLQQYKLSIENAKKDELINSFKIADEDKAEIIENKEKYTFDEIKSKLSVIYVEKYVNFNSEDSSKNEKEVEKPNLYSLPEEDASVPAYIIALRNNRKKNNI